MRVWHYWFLGCVNKHVRSVWLVVTAMNLHYGLMHVYGCAVVR